MNIGFLIFPCLERFLTPRVSGFLFDYIVQDNFHKKV